MSLLCGLGLAGFIAYGAWTEPSGDPAAAIRSVETVLAKFRDTFTPNAKGKATADIFDQLALWDELEKISGSLTAGNQFRAKAKAMVYLPQNPERYSTYVWEHRYKLSKEPWELCETSQRIFRSIAETLSAFFIATLACWIALLIIAWLWYFVLDRLSELSNSIRDHHQQK